MCWGNWQSPTLQLQAKPHAGGIARALCNSSKRRVNYRSPALGSGWPEGAGAVSGTKAELLLADAYSAGDDGPAQVTEGFCRGLVVSSSVQPFPPAWPVPAPAVTRDVDTGLLCFAAVVPGGNASAGIPRHARCCTGQPRTVSANCRRREPLISRRVVTWASCPATPALGHLLDLCLGAATTKEVVEDIKPCRAPLSEAALHESWLLCPHRPGRSHSLLVLSSFSVRCTCVLPLFVFSSLPSPLPGKSTTVQETTHTRT